jgi:hypothetical protein
MELNKLENEIREKLIKREIQPSAQTWDRLDAMLSVEESKSRKKDFPWIKIAASLVCFLGVGYFLYNSGDNTIKKVDSNVVVFEETKEPADNETKIDQVKIASSTKSIIEENNKSLVASESKNKISKKDEIVEIIRTNKDEELALNGASNDKIVLLEVQNQSKIILETNEQQKNESNNQVVAEIKNSVKKQKLKIDPNSLLDQVDGEIQLTFRQKVMKTVTKGYKEAKEAVASRNQESSINY